MRRFLVRRQGRRCRSRRGRCRRGVARTVASALLVVLVAGCGAADDGTRVRDRDGAGVLFEETS